MQLCRSLAPQTPAGGFSLVRHDRATGEARVLASPPGPIDLVSIDPDEGWIGFRAGTLWVVRRDGTGLRAIAGAPYRVVQRGLPVWSAGGRAYFVALPADAGDGATTGHLYELDAAGGGARPVTTAWRVRTVGAVSRDGRRLLIVRDNPQTPDRGGILNDAEIHLVELPVGEDAP